MDNNSCPFTQPDCEKRHSNVIVVCVVVVLTVPILVLAIYAVYLHCKGKLRSENANRVEALEAANSTIGRTRQSTPSGLDKLTLDSYPVLVVGEGGREFEQHEGQKCSICLLDYQAKDIIKTLPGCLHCFHADCIDQWLFSDATCPICRASPPRSSP